MERGGGRRCYGLAPAGNFHCSWNLFLLHNGQIYALDTGRMLVDSESKREIQVATIKQQHTFVTRNLETKVGDTHCSHFVGHTREFLFVTICKLHLI